jgi:hypothetical protein
MIDSNYELKIGEEVLKGKDELLSLTATESAKTYGDPPQPLLAAGIAESVDALLKERFGERGYEKTQLETTWSEELAAWLLRPKRVEIVERAAAVPEPTTSAVEVKEARMAATPTNLGSKLAACTSSYLPKGAFGKAPEVEFLCTETDPRTGAGKLHAAVVSAAPKGGVPPTDAMKIFARIGWYDMAAFAVVRAGCCPEAPPISLPDAQCGMDASLRAIGEAVIASKPTVEPLKAYTDSIHCELNRGGAKWLRRSERPAGGEDTAFLELLKNLE